MELDHSLQTYKLVGEQVLHALGQPEHLLCVQSRRLWAGHYRVNVFVGADSSAARVAGSPRRVKVRTANATSMMMYTPSANRTIKNQT